MDLSEDVLTRANGIILACILVAVAGFYGLGAYTTIGDIGRYAVLIGIGVLLPTVILNSLGE